MSTFDYHVVDVFTDRAFAGNPLAVVLDADTLSTAQMQAIAREFNLSETTFVLRPTMDAATYRARIFTPMSELPFAGHPSVGTAWLLRELGRYGTGTVVQECGAGLLPIVVGDERVELTGGAPFVGDPVAADDFLAALGLSPADLQGTPVRWAGCGIDWAFLHVRDSAIARAQVDLVRLARLGRAGVCVFSYADGHAHSRCFAADLGVPEDPATGSAALGLGVFLVASGILPGNGETAYTIAQGVEMGRPSWLHGTVVAAGGAAREVRVAGQTVPIASGQITAPARD